MFIATSVLQILTLFSFLVITTHSLLMPNVNFFFDIEPVVEKHELKRQDDIYNHNISERTDGFEFLKNVIMTHHPFLWKTCSKRKLYDISLASDRRINYSWEALRILLAPL